MGCRDRSPAERGPTRVKCYMQALHAGTTQTKQTVWGAA